MLRYPIRGFDLQRHTCSQRPLTMASMLPSSSGAIDPCSLHQDIRLLVLSSAGLTLEQKQLANCHAWTSKTARDVHIMKSETTAGSLTQFLRRLTSLTMVRDKALRKKLIIDKHINLRGTVPGHKPCPQCSDSEGVSILTLLQDKALQVLVINAISTP